MASQRISDKGGSSGAIGSQDSPRPQVILIINENIEK